LARLVALISLGSGAVLDWAMVACKGKGSGEHALFRQLFDSLQPGDVVSVFDWVAMHLRLAPTPDEDFRMPDAERGSQGAA